MTDLRKAAEMLMKALDDGWVERGDNVAIALRQTLAQPEQESISTNKHLCAMLRQVHDVLACTALPMKRPWVGLTDEEQSIIYNDLYTQYTRDDVNIVDFILIARAIESALRSKNNAV